ncbi:MAG: GGDEF domain-containing protein, partial [Dehalococcoidia bacterium]
LGAAVSAAVLAWGLAASDDATIFGWSAFGMSHDLWGLIATLAALTLLTQMVVNSRAALQRERRLVRTATQLREASAELDRLARTDALTGIPNRRALFERFGVEFRRSRRYGRDLAALMIDLDDFKAVNDAWGHPFADAVLRETAEVIAAIVRESDILGRYGGEEFALVLPETSLEDALSVAEKVRAAIAVTEFRPGDVPPPDAEAVRITVSIGVAALPVEDDQDEFELIRRADQALYEAKRSGRNRVTVFTKAEFVTEEQARAGS